MVNVADLIAAAREWLIVCFPEQEDEIVEATPRTIQDEINRLYDGGWYEFVMTNSNVSAESEAKS